MTCLNATFCGNKPHYYFDWCNYMGSDGYYYAPNHLNTCRRSSIDTLYASCETCRNSFKDCCSNNRDDCCLKGTNAVPTNSPTSSPTQMCIRGETFYYQEEDRCRIYEYQNTDISVYQDNLLVCCSEHRDECCVVRSTLLFSLLTVILLFTSLSIFYFLREPSKKIVPTTKQMKILPV